MQGEKNNADPEDVADPKVFIEAKLRKRASESRNIRNPAVFDVGYRPTKYSSGRSSRGWPTT